MYKKIIILIFLMGLFILAGSLLFKASAPPVVTPEAPAPEELYNVSSPEFYKKRFGNTPPSNFNNQALKDSLHEGTAVFIGNFRLELSVSKINEKYNLISLHMKNSKAYPITPKDTEIKVKINNEEIRLIPVDNGLFVNQSNKFSLPQKVVIYGKIRGSVFTTELTLNNFYKNGLNELPINKNKDKK